jgi:tetratricopeptide (TPR) repeat protein
MKTFWAVFIFTLFMVSSTCKAEDNSYLKYYVRGLMQEKQGQDEEAIQSYKETLTKGGETSYVYIKLGNLYLKNKSYPKAEECFRNALNLDEQNSDALFGLGVINLIADNKLKASQYFEEGLRQNPSRNRFRLLLCDIYVALEKYDQAAVQYKFLLEDLPNNALLRYNYANLLQRLGDGKQAEEEYLKATAISPGFWKSHLALGILYQQQGQIEKAKRSFEQTIKFNPKNAAAYSLLAGIYYRENNSGKASRILLAAIEKGIEQQSFYNFLGNLYLESKNYQTAENYFEKSLKLEENEQILFHLGVVYDYLDKKEKMEATMKKVINMNPEHALALNYLGYSYLLEDRNLTEALHLIKKACSLEPNNGAFLDSLGWAYYKMGRYKLAETYLQKAASMENDHEINEHLGHLYFKTGHYEKALLWWAKSYEMEQNKYIMELIEKAKQRIRNETY